MKKNLRLLCLGLAAATVTCGFAQEDKTSLLKNADMEQGLKGWAIDGTDVVGKNTKLASTKIGFHGMSQGVQEAWHSNAAEPLGDSYVMQRLQRSADLPSGTYVFGAYAAAARQYNRKDLCEQNSEGEHVLVDGKHQYSDYWSNRDSINGVVLFANDATVRVAVDNPDLAERGFLWGHSSKFNVAVELTEEDTRLDVGMRVSSTNANYIVWDNATLYYFGNKSKEEALDAMAEIDMTNAVAIADTLVGYKMNVDSLNTLTTAIATAKEATTTAATLWDDSKALHEAAAFARKSIIDYSNLKKNIESAKLLTDESIEWTQDWTPGLVDILDEVIAAAEEAYEVAELDREGLTALRKELNWAAGDVHVDSVYAAKATLEEYNFSAQSMVNKPGGITQGQLDELNALLSEIADTITAYEAELEYSIEEKTVNPNNLLSYIARVEEAIQSVEDNPISTEYTKMPITFAADANNYVEGTTLVDDSKKIMGYISPLYRFPNKIETFRITVKKANHGGNYFCLSELEFIDGNGVKIELTEENVTSNADHNALNGTPDGGGIAAMFDGSTGTYFHSAWQNSPSEAHYLEITLPGGGYDMFQFKMYSRDNSNGHDQRRTFPAEMVLSTPMPKREALEATINEAKALNVYSLPEVGFYVNDFTFLTDELAKAEAALATWPTEDECDQLRKDLQKQIQKFKDPSLDKSIHLPKAGVEYRIVSGFPDFYKKQFVEKALTVHAADTTLWWENVCADSLQQVFMFEPINPDEDGFPSVEIESGENEDGTTWETVKYLYTIKNVASQLYVDSAFTNNQVRFAKEATDTVRLVSLGRGQWNIVLKNGTFHAGDHYSGTPSESAGAYGGIYGISSGIVNWTGGLDGASAWMIREYPELPLTALVKAGEYKSECFHFQAANTVTLTADKACAFTNLALYDLYGNAIEVAEVVVEGNKATITTVNNIVGCAFAFTNNEGVSSVSFNAFEFTAAIELLQAAYDAAVAVAPVEGTEVMQYADLSEYNAALADAEAMIEAGAATDEAIEAMIAKLEAVVAALVPNMPEAGKYYFFYSSVTAFEERNGGLKMTLYSEGTQNIRWGFENALEWTRYWQFERATAEELKAAGMSETAVAFYIKSVAAEGYIGDISVSDGVTSSLKANKADAMPIVLTSLGGQEVALDGLGQSGKRLHANNHGGGAGKGSNIVYWGSGVGTASSWTIVETQFDVTDIDFAEVETEAPVVKGTFDLFGRRIAAPTAPGLYIIDGKKRYIK